MGSDGDPLVVQPGPSPQLSGLTHLWNFINTNRHKGLWIHPSLTFIFSERYKFGVGAFSTVDLTENTIVVKIPKSCVLSVRNLDSMVLQDILLCGDFEGLVGLTVAYIYESCKGERSPFYGYLTCFTYPDVPLMWKQEETELLKGSEVEAKGGLSPTYICKIYEKSISPLVSKHPELFSGKSNEITLVVWARAYIIVTSRAFEIDSYHGLALVPIADIFNYTHAGNADVSFECETIVCKCCGRPPDPMCGCDLKTCKFCGLVLTKCLCPPSRRIEMIKSSSSGPSSTAVQEPIEEIEITGLDPKGAGWVSKRVIDRGPSHPDIIEMTLTRTITSVGQLFNNYGSFTNPILLLKYGFIDERCQTDCVCLRRELFDRATAVINVCPERCEWWKTKGFDFLDQLAEHSPLHLREFEVLMDRNEISGQGEGFVDWTLTIGKHGWVRYPLKIWMLVCLLKPEDWRAFKESDMETQAKLFYPWLTMFEAPVIAHENLEMCTKWYKVLEKALERRYARYDVEFEYSEWCQWYKKFNELGEAWTRKAFASWIRYMEESILNDCSRRVKSGLAAIEKQRMKIPGVIPVSKDTSPGADTN